MILQEKPIEIEISGEIETVPYLIKAHRESFRTLFSTLYSDKIKAIIRELSTNAADSQVAAGKPDEQFIVHLPNSLEPFFSVKDTGTGLSHQDITTIYRTFFDSNKTRTNDQTGCLGLGSKSPFSYTDQYSIESIHDGVKRIYNSFINKDGIPSLGKIGETQTREPNGVEIKFAVKSFDFSAFATKASEVLRWFKVSPKVIGVAEFSFPKIDYLIEKPTYQIYRVKTQVSYVVMGNVAYPIGYNNLWNLDLSNQERKILEWGANIYVPIGSLEITANRESINFDKDSIKVIKSVLADALIDTKTLAQDELKNVRTAWEARKIVYRNKHSLLYSLHGQSNLSWKGQIISETLTAPKGVQIERIEQFRSRKKRRNEYGLTPNDNPIYINDLERGGIIRINNDIKVKGTPSAYQLTGFVTNSSSSGATDTKFAQINPKWLEEEGLNKIIIYASTLPKPVYAPRSSGNGKNYSLVYKYINNKTGRAADSWQEEKMDMSQGGVYVEIMRYYIQDKKGQTLPPNIIDNVARAINILYGTTLYGIRPSDIEKVHKENPGKWVELEKYCKTQMSNVKIIEKMALSSEYKKLTNTSFLDDSFKVTDFEITSPFALFLQECRNARKINNDSNTALYNYIFNYFQITYPDNKLLENKRIKLFNKTYPLLPYYNKYTEGCTKAFTDYINMMDKAAGI